MNEINIPQEFEDKIRRAVSVPDANDRFVKQLKTTLTSHPRVEQPKFWFRSPWTIPTRAVPVLAVAFALILALLLLSTPRVVTALQQLFGYLPGVGLVESTGDLRMLAEPVAVTRQGITLTVKNLLVFTDHVELIYDVDGIDPANDGVLARDGASNPTAFCGGVNVGDMASQDGNALLTLPDGTVLERDDSFTFPQNAFAMTPVYQASVPDDVTSLTMNLDCIPWARHGAVPENWEIPLVLTRVPAGTVIGAQVIEVPPSTEIPAEAPALEQGAPPVPEQAAATGQAEMTPAGTSPAAPLVNLELEKIVPLESATVFFFSLNMPAADPSLVSIMPQEVYIEDSSGQRLQLFHPGPLQPFENPPGSLFEYTSLSRPAPGPLSLYVENAVAYYAPLYIEPRQATPEEMSFSFDAGEAPHSGQTWEINQSFNIAGYAVEVVSARAVQWEDVQDPSYIDGSQGYDYGYQFAIQAEPGMKMNVAMDIRADKCGLTVGNPYAPESSKILYTQLCRDAYPQGKLTVLIHQISVLLEDTWQTTWTP